MTTFLSKSISGIALSVGIALVSGNAFAQAINQPPPAGAILDLAGLPITGNTTPATVSFTAGLTSTAITFAFRNDPSFTSFGEVSLIDVTTGSGNLLFNGDFSGGTYTDNGNSATPNDWTYANIYGASDGGVISSGCDAAFTSGYCWVDGAVQAYDAISQTVATTAGDTYQISFLYQGEGDSVFSDLSTNGDITNTGGNGNDILAYAQAGLPAAGSSATPEPDSLVLMGTGLAGALRMMLRRRSSK